METNFGLMIQDYFRNYHKGSKPQEDHELFKDFMEGYGYRQESQFKDESRLLLMDTYLAYIGDDRESYYREKPFACVKAPKDINVESGAAVGALLRNVFGREFVHRVRGSRTTLPYWSITVDAEDIHWPGGRTTKMDVVNDGDDDITTKCFVFF